MLNRVHKWRPCFYHPFFFISAPFSLQACCLIEKMKTISAKVRFYKHMPFSSTNTFNCDSDSWKSLCFIGSDHSLFPHVAPTPIQPPALSGSQVTLYHAHLYSSCHFVRSFSTLMLTPMSVRWPWELWKGLISFFEPQDGCLDSLVWWAFLLQRIRFTDNLSPLIFSVQCGWSPSILTSAFSCSLSNIVTVSAAPGQQRDNKEFLSCKPPQCWAACERY